ncbi:hypothetical protein SAMN05421678_1327 [Actinopolymorpha cephalotaxi]|uniref:Uncharacterized protein n=1 Tax=Actinopolymorpha cephalotaxi TaxID=504797 RepID=A0A1I3CDU8_9ACTN|nr:hypothetical protein [Actinopolymorpha cephalotaxi]SFH72476.1 hypothetical protein SAMN05421678_1327 [Actinopolymorpha cephalotaxi]
MVRLDGRDQYRTPGQGIINRWCTYTGDPEPGTGKIHIFSYPPPFTEGLGWSTASTFRTSC